MFIISGSSAQIGGTYSYEWLGSPTSARMTGLSNSLITVSDDDLALGLNNPSLLNIKMDKKLSINHNFSFAGVSNGYLGYSHSLDSITHMSIGVNYASYGDFIHADELGNNLGSFSGSEVAVVVGGARQLNARISVGANVKGIFGNMESFTSSAVATDFGIRYKNPSAFWAIAFLVKNIGIQLSKYGNETSPTPLDVQIGYSRKLKHLPFRFSLLLHNLHRYGIRYDDPNNLGEVDLFGNPINQPSSISKAFDNFFRHVNFGGEFLLGKTGSFRIRFGYSHLRRKELSVTNFRSLAGFTTGFGLRIKGIRLDYGLGYHHVSGAANHLSLSMGLDRFYQKR